MKLPIIYIHDGLASYLPDAPSSASFSIHVSMTARNHATIAYEPRVGRCETCRFFVTEYDVDNEPFRDCAENTFDEGVPDDGSGFCHSYEPRAMP
jgi:hypothetical protein